MSNQLVRYVLVGSVAYGIEMAVLYGLRYGVSLSAVRAVAISFWAGFVVAFVLQKLVAFQNHDKRPHVVARQLTIYSLLVAFNYGFTLIATNVFATKASVFVIRTAVIAIVTVWNFAAYRVLFRQSQTNLPV